MFCKRKRARGQQPGAPNDFMLLMDSDLNSERARVLRSNRSNNAEKSDTEKGTPEKWKATSASPGRASPVVSQPGSSGIPKTVSVPDSIYRKRDDTELKSYLAGEEALKELGGEENADTTLAASGPADSPNKRQPDSKQKSNQTNAASSDKDGAVTEAP